MSKTVADLLHEFSFEHAVEDDFCLHVLKVTVGASEVVEQLGGALPIVKVEIDHQDRTCLLHFEESDNDAITITLVRDVLVPEVLGYEVFAAQEKVVDEACLRYETPLIGFGENIELRCFFAICLV